jgi:hypothetical protein
VFEVVEIDECEREMATATVVADNPLDMLLDESAVSRQSERLVTRRSVRTTASVGCTPWVRPFGLNAGLFTNQPFDIQRDIDPTAGVVS